MYQPPSDWKGRIDSATDALAVRYHQKVQVKNITELRKIDPSSKRMGIIGFRCDEGVRRNGGRVGAAEAPTVIRKALTQIPWHHSSHADLVDAGDFYCDSEKLEEAQEELGIGVCRLLGCGIHPIILGGGHETLFGHYLGVRDFIGPTAELGIINIDAHLDMRPYQTRGSSGTMFRQILDRDFHAGYLCAGVQKSGNTMSLFKAAEEYGVEMISEELLNIDQIDRAVK